MDVCEPATLTAPTRAAPAREIIVRKTGIMGIVPSGGQVCVQDVIRAEVPAGPNRQLKCV